MKLTVLLLTLISLAACKDRELFHAEMQKNFVQCMELAAKNARTVDGDVSDIVDSCKSVAINLTNN